MIFKGYEKVFCAGGDVKEFTRDPEEHYSRTLFDYATNCKTYEMIANYRKPYIALVDGLAMGGAAFFATQDTAYRVATERTTFSMPETALGYFNDAGGSYFLPRLEKNFGVFNFGDWLSSKGIRHEESEAGDAFHRQLEACRG